jgi:hypothetical protein
MTDQPEQPITATEVNDACTRSIMAATHSVWSVFDTDNACTTPIITTTSDTHPFAAQEWVDIRAAELQGLVNFGIDTSTTGLTRLSEIITELTTSTDHTLPAGTVTFDIATVFQDAMEACPEPVDPQEMESSSPLRAEDDCNDTMGQQYDNGFEMGEAEEWFRSKIQVRP